MILISRRAFVVLGVVVVVMTGLLGAYGYRSIATLGSAALFAAQQFLYVSLLLVVVELILFGRVLARSRNIERELDKLIEITRFRGLPNARNLRRLGPIGEQISRLYDQINSLSERKSLKISSLSDLVEFLMDNLSLPAVAATVVGTIVYVSRVYTERMKRPKSELLDTRLEELVPGVSVSEVIGELERSHTAVQRKSERSAVNFYPIRNSSNQIAYVVCVFQGHAALFDQESRVAPVESGRGRAGGGVRRLLGLGRQTIKRLSAERGRSDQHR